MRVLFIWCIGISYTFVEKMASSAMKTCYKCGKSKNRTEFSKDKNRSDGLDPRCKVCKNAYQKKLREDPAYRKRAAEYRQTEEAKKKRRTRENARGRTDCEKLMNKLKCRLHSFAILMIDSPLNRETMGCTLAEFRAHIEKQFKGGMTWDNHGVWEFDHDVPYKAFPTVEELEDYEKVVCWYRNVQPMLKADNSRKGAKCPPGKKQALITKYVIHQVLISIVDSVVECVEGVSSEPATASASRVRVPFV